MAAKVYLVGAGPGDPELLTRKAWRLLQSADVVLHDDLVPQEILREIPETAQIVNVGKRCGTRGISQPEINFWMVSLAREGKIVARLKSGDPTLFGRAGEEIGALRQAGIEFEIVPGVTSALGAAAAAQISQAGERLGFLPGDLSQKVDPYLRPLYDALFEMLGFEKVEKLIERNVIEVAPLAYMRGRTLNDAFIILDESQNTTIEQMKMFLTRIGFNSKAVITGDITQIDLPRSTKSGLRHAIEVLAEVDEISFNFFHSEDVVRHPVVARIVNAYERDARDPAATRP